MMKQGMSRRAAAAAIVLTRFGVMLTCGAGACAASAAADLSDPSLLVLVTYVNPVAFRDAARRKRIEVVRVIAFEKPDGRVTVLALMRRSLFEFTRLDPEARIQLVNEPPTDPAQIPKVGDGNRFANPRVLPQGEGVIRRR
jgi:hypothetical protein